MKTSVGLFVLAMTFAPISVSAQQAAKKPVSAAKLELTTEVAATTEEGYPSVLRITLKNVGSVAVEMPMPSTPCVAQGGGIGIRYDWHSDDPSNHDGIGSGWGCSADMAPSLDERIKNWIHLKPGESVVLGEKFRSDMDDLKKGTVEYWAEYTPPEMTAQEFDELTNSSHVIPNEKLESEHKSFHVQ